MPSSTPEGEENKEHDRHIFERFVRVSGGDASKIVVIPTASRMHEAGPRYERLFSDLGAAEVATMDFDTRRDCHEPGRLKRLEGVSASAFLIENTELEAAQRALDWARPGDVLGLLVHASSAREAVLSLLAERQNHHSGSGAPKDAR